MKSEFKERDYKIEISKLSNEDGGGYLAVVPALAGCMSDGETVEEALVNAKDAIKCWIETANELGRAIPEGQEYKSDDDYSGKLSLRIPKSLHKKIAEQAEKEGTSINQLITIYVSMGIGNEFGKNKVEIMVNNQLQIPTIENIVFEKWKKSNNYDFGQSNRIANYFDNNTFDSVDLF